MGIMALYSDIIGERNGPDSWAGKIIWQCPESEAVANGAGLYNTIMPGSAGNYPPRCVRVRIHHNAEPGRAWLTAYYKNSREPGKARIIGAISSSARRATRDVNGNIIEGPDKDGYNWWQITKGSNIVTEGVEVVVLKTAWVGQPDIPAARAARGRINASACPNFGNAPAESLLLWKLAYKYEYGSDLWYLDYWFKVCPECDDNGTVKSWNAITETRRGAWLLMKQRVWEQGEPGSSPSDWGLSDQEAVMKVFVPEIKVGLKYNEELDADLAGLYPANSAVVVPMFKTADFSQLDAMIEW